nr:hypothetical protein KXZ65_22195 [Pectobacterium sp. PL152]
MHAERYGILFHHYHESGGMMVQRIKIVRKHQRKSKIDDNRTLMQVGARASKQAIKEALIPVYQSLISKMAGWSAKHLMVRSQKLNPWTVNRQLSLGSCFAELETGCRPEWFGQNNVD